MGVAGDAVVCGEFMDRSPLLEPKEFRLRFGIARAELQCEPKVPEGFIRTAQAAEAESEIGFSFRVIATQSSRSLILSDGFLQTAGVGQQAAQIFPNSGI